MNKKLWVLSLIALAQTSLVACDATASNQTKATDTQTKEQTKATRNIDAKFMREHIFDYKANPTQFVFKGQRPAIVDFYADWCGPCRQLSPRLEALAKKYAGKIDVYKVNVDNESELASVFGVRSIPMLLFIGMDGAMPSVSQGALGDKELESEAQRLLATVKAE